MIFVTVGHQTPYDRLLRLVDLWAGERGRSDLFAQIGEGSYRPAHFPSQAFLSPAEFDARMQGCSAVVAHAGTGTIIKALLLGKPLLVLPRVAALGETRSDHQWGTARHFAESGRILMAEDEAAFPALLDSLEGFRPSGSLGAQASPELLARIRAFVGQ
ncbi:MAG: glucuronosyltransferase [Gammaproteobacteria bacterium]|nr:glucuronosyltransferase [Gammaproteobacteria bacterium]MBU1653557.1 glucuronosyltransferase [Gammaproteobacteria bacterium]MBU1961899.1 glucuronosyltransferase [Gammaproteobacteria bacterium]